MEGLATTRSCARLRGFNMKHLLAIRLCALSGIMLLASTSTFAFAQNVAGTPGAAADPSGLEEIIVTATKRSENLQAIPISVSAISGDAISKSRVTQMDDLVTNIANLQLTFYVPIYN